MTMNTIPPFTKSDLLKRGHCCQSGCFHCPYDYQNKADPNVPAEFGDCSNEHYHEEALDEDENN